MDDGFVRSADLLTIQYAATSTNGRFRNAAVQRLNHRREAGLADCAEAAHAATAKSILSRWVVWAASCIDAMLRLILLFPESVRSFV